MDWKEVIENLKYLISEDCTDTQFDYADEIEIAIRVMESQEDLRSKINKAIEEIEFLRQHRAEYITKDSKICIDSGEVLEILKRTIGE